MNPLMLMLLMGGGGGRKGGMSRKKMLLLVLMMTGALGAGMALGGAEGGGLNSMLPFLLLA